MRALRFCRGIDIDHCSGRVQLTPKVSGVHDQIQPEMKSHYHHSL